MVPRLVKGMIAGFTLTLTSGLVNSTTGNAPPVFESHAAYRIEPYVSNCQISRTAGTLEKMVDSVADLTPLESAGVYHPNLETYVRMPEVHQQSYKPSRRPRAHAGRAHQC